MRIACPSCAAAYDVPDRLLAGTARALRCSRCGAGFALPAAAPVVAVPPAVPVPSAEPPLAEAPPPPRDAPAPAPRERAPVAAGPGNQAALLRAWVVSLVLVAGAILGLLLFRSQVMAAWPPATRLFVVLGLA